MKYGVLVQPEGDMRAFTETVKWLDTLTMVDGIWIPDHMVRYNPNGSGTYIPRHDTLTCASLAAAHTKRLNIGTLVLPYLLYNPVQLAKAVFTLNNYLLDERIFYLGLGTGAPNDPSYEMLNIDFPPYAERVAHFHAYLDTLMLLFKREPTVKGYIQQPVLPEGKPPHLVIASHNKSIIEVIPQLGSFVTIGAYGDNIENIIQSATQQSEWFDNACKNNFKPPNEATLKIFFPYGKIARISFVTWLTFHTLRNTLTHMGYNYLIVPFVKENSLIQEILQTGGHTTLRPNSF